jgi:predicted permease
MTTPTIYEEIIIMASNSTDNNRASAIPVPLILALTSLSATLEVLLMVVVGMILYYRKVLQDSHVKVLGALVFQIFTPCMLCFKFATSVDLPMLKTAYLAVALALFNVLCANVLARLIFFKCIWRKRLAGIRSVVVNVAITFNNAGTLPFVFVSALCKTGNIFLNSQDAENRAIAYISLYLLPVQILFWSFGMIAMKNKPSKENEENQNVTLVTEPMIEKPADLTEDMHLEEEELRKSLSNENLAGTNHEESSAVDIQLESVEVTEQSHTMSQSAFQRLKGMWQSVRKNMPPISHIITPPTYGCFVGIIVALVPHVKEFLVTNPPAIVSTLPHVARLFGDTVFPLSMILLGANLANTMMAASPINNDQSNEEKERNGKKLFFIRRFIKHNDPLVVFTAVVTRLVIMPLIGMGVCLGLIYLKLLPSDPVLILVLMVESSTPTAINTSILCVLNDNNGLYEMCEVLLFMYLSAPITLSIMSTIYLYLACHFSPGQCNL